MASLPYGAVEQDTAEFMLGTVVATVVFFESDGSIDPSTKDWNALVRDEHGEPLLDSNGNTISAGGPNYIEFTKSRVKQGLQWWEDTLVNFYAEHYDGMDPIHSLDFIIDWEYAHNPIQTGYEPIDRISDDYALWVPDFLTAVGYYNTGSISTDIRTFNNAQRLKYGADWAYTIFVVNDYGDVDLRFKEGGSFSQAFAFSGGRFVVVPSQRPPSTFAHESGHIFYALDEYYPAGSYLSRRGYYNTQNLNAWDNPDPDYVDQPSIMYNGTPLQIAWNNHVSSDSSLRAIGWQDSDGDGVFDVLDVPLTLTGAGFYNPVTQHYEFTGHSQVQTLPNLNSAGRRNDITINKVSQAVYSLDGGATWLVGHDYNTYAADITLSIAMLPGQEIMIRTQSVDPRTDKIVTTSEHTFWGTTQFPTAITDSGIQGYVWYDKDGDGVWDATERGIPGWTLQLVDAHDQPIQLRKHLEPDGFSQYALLGSVLPGVTLTATGYDVKDARVGAVESAPTSTGTQVFGAVRLGSGTVWVTDWTTESRNLRIDLAQPATTISIDAVGPAGGGYGRLEIYGAGDTLLGRYTTRFLPSGAVETMTLSVHGEQITYAIVRSALDSSIRLDNLRVGPAATATTDAAGFYTLPHLPAGSYRVQALPSSDWDVASPVSGIRDVVVDAEGHMVWVTGTPRPSDFVGTVSSAAPPWRNPFNLFDVNDDGFTSPIDALRVINELNAHGSYVLSPPTGGSTPPPYYDVTGDGYLSPMDALWIINELNRRSNGSSGSGESGGGGLSSGGDPDGGDEGESWSLADDGLAHRTDDDRRSELVGRSAIRVIPDHQSASPESVGWVGSATEETLALVASDVARARRALCELEVDARMVDAWAPFDHALLPETSRDGRRRRSQ